MTLRTLGVILASVVYGGATAAFVLTAFVSAGISGGVAVAWAFGVGVLVGNRVRRRRVEGVRGQL
jgi:hypothetical protein